MGSIQSLCTDNRYNGQSATDETDHNAVGYGDGGHIGHNKHGGTGGVVDDGTFENTISGEHENED